jgi:hypothetical protein
MDMNLQWRKATYSSGNGGNCIEVATADRTVAVRDSKDPDGPGLAFGIRAWQAFAAKLKGERSLPTSSTFAHPIKALSCSGAPLAFALIRNFRRGT